MKKLLFILLVLSPGFLLGQNNPFKAVKKSNAKVTYTNPVIPGFYSDPSVCRVGDDYYMVTSTFEYFPGVPIFHSKDLVNWNKIGHCITREEQLSRGKLNIYAATLRYNKGKFYMITTNMMGGTFYVTATNPKGPWSNPIKTNVSEIDPDLFWDDDGKAYVINSAFQLYEIDLETGKLLTEGKKIWNGTGGRYAEGPHLYKKDGYYYLLAAEGGTEEAHSVTIARSHSIWGPYINNPANPILTHCNAAGQGSLIQGVGHADIIQAEDNSWWMVFHGYRKFTIWSNAHHILGRETCLAPVSWPENGWPVVNGNGTISEEMTCPTLPLKPISKKETARIDFDEPLGLDWNYIQYPDWNNYSIEDRKGFLRLKGTAKNIYAKSTSTFVGRRLTDLSFTATTSIEFDPKNENEEAGVTLVNNGSHFDMLIKKEGNQRKLFIKLQFGRTSYTSAGITLKEGPVEMRVKGSKSKFTFSYRQEGDGFINIEKADAKFLASETVGGYTGVYVGLYATGNGQVSDAYADYDWFEYK